MRTYPRAMIGIALLAALMLPAQTSSAQYGHYVSPETEYWQRMTGTTFVGGLFGPVGDIAGLGAGWVWNQVSPPRGYWTSGGGFLSPSQQPYMPMRPYYGGYWDGGYGQPYYGDDPGYYGGQPGYNYGGSYGGGYSYGGSYGYQDQLMECTGCHERFYRRQGHQCRQQRGRLMECLGCHHRFYEYDGHQCSQHQPRFNNWPSGQHNGQHGGQVQFGGTYWERGTTTGPRPAYGPGQSFGRSYDSRQHRGYGRSRRR